MLSQEPKLTWINASERDELKKLEAALPMVEKTIESATEVLAKLVLANAILPNQHVESFCTYVVETLKFPIDGLPTLMKERLEEQMSKRATKNKVDTGGSEAGKADAKAPKFRRMQYM